MTELIIAPAYSHEKSTPQKNLPAVINRIGIYNHFLSKEAVFQAILTESHPLLHQGTSLNSGEINRETAQTMLNEIDQYPEFFNLILIEIVEFKGKHLPELFESCTHDIPPPGL
ncbi:MAG: hypothetical protein WCK35_19605 [Chloroflexota bacterium]